MNQKTMLILAAAAVGLYLLKKNQAAGAYNTASAKTYNTNIQSDMLSRIAGGAWRQLVDAQNDDGTAAFLKKTFTGQVVTSDGKPVNDNLDSFGMWMQTNVGLDGNPVQASDSTAVENFMTKLGLGADQLAY